jgi:hypothetical protein
MSSQTFKVSVDKVFFDTIRGKSGGPLGNKGPLGGEHDNDWATLTITTTKDGHTRSWPGYQLASEIISGALVEDLQPPFELTDFVIDDDDSFLITLQIVNQASESTLEKALTWSAGVIGALGTATAALGAAPAAAGKKPVAIAIAEGAIEGAIAGALTALDVAIHHFWPKCGGLVFNRAYQRTVAQLLQDTQGEVGRAFTYPADPDVEKNDEDCGGDPVTRVNLSITLTANDPDFGSLPPGSAGPPGPPVKIKSLSIAPGTAWSGRWEDAKSRIFCNVTATEPSVLAPGTDGTTAILNAAASSITLTQVLTRLGTDPRNPPRDVVRSSSPANEVGLLNEVVFGNPPSASAGVAGLAGGLTSGGGAGGLSAAEGTVLAAIWRFGVNVTEVVPAFGGGSNVTAQSNLAVAVPMVVVPRIGDQYASLLTKEAGLLKGVVLGDAPEPVSSKVGLLKGVAFGDASAPVTGATGMAGGLTAGGGAGTTNQIAPALAPPELGATIPVSDNVFLQLYAGFDAQGRFVDHQIRYLRIGSNGEVASDVMLTHQQTLG